MAHVPHYYVWQTAMPHGSPLKQRVLALETNLKGLLLQAFYPTTQLLVLSNLSNLYVGLVLSMAAYSMDTLLGLIANRHDLVGLNIIGYYFSSYLGP